MRAQVKELKWGDSTIDVSMGATITEEEQRVIQERMKELDLVLRNEKKPATYKLEVLFNNERSVHKAFGGLVTWWHSGNKLHGGGDSKIYLCPGKERINNGCSAFLYDQTNSLNFIVCSACGSLWKGEDVHGEVYYRLPMERWADVLLSWFLRLGLDADIRLKYSKTDLRSVAMQEQERQRGGELLHKARSEAVRQGGIYTLDRIIKDTSAGADLRGRILAFLKA